MCGDKCRYAGQAGTNTTIHADPPGTMTWNLIAYDSRFKMWYFLEEQEEEQFEHQEKSENHIFSFKYICSDYY